MAFFALLIANIQSSSCNSIPHFYRTSDDTLTALPVLSSTTGQYHTQDELGRYSFGYYEPQQIRKEKKDESDVVTGYYRCVFLISCYFNFHWSLFYLCYSYVNEDGSIFTNYYIADDNGFRSSVAPSNGPLGPPDPSVIAAGLPLKTKNLAIAVPTQSRPIIYQGNIIWWH